MRDDEFYECEELAMPVTIHKQEITCDRDDKNNFIALINEYNADIFIKVIIFLCTFSFQTSYGSYNIYGFNIF